MWKHSVKALKTCKIKIELELFPESHKLKPEIQILRFFMLYALW